MLIKSKVMLGPQHRWLISFCVRRIFFIAQLNWTSCRQLASTSTWKKETDQHWKTDWYQFKIICFYTFEEISEAGKREYSLKLPFAADADAELSIWFSKLKKKYYFYHILLAGHRSEGSIDVHWSLPNRSMMAFNMMHKFSIRYLLGSSLSTLLFSSFLIKILFPEQFIPRQGEWRAVFFCLRKIWIFFPLSTPLNLCNLESFA